MVVRDWQCAGRSARSFCLLLFLMTLLAPPNHSVLYAATVPCGFTDSLVVNGLSNPTAMEFAPDGRLFVCEQGGALRVIKDGALLANPFLTVTVDSSGERGLLGVAFDPAFAINQYVYIYYTATAPAVHNRVSRFVASGDSAVPGSETTILELDDLSGATNHNGGAIHFGVDGTLYVAVGDNANSNNAQSLMTLHGKMLRIFRDGEIPSNNPFYKQATGNNRAIWALGLRNPFTFSFQPGTGRMFINDVGQNTWEEINDGIAGSNYGWPTCEGNCNPPNTNFRDPIYSYVHDGATCAITGGAFYNPQTPRFPNTYVGNYFFADFCAGWIMRLDPANGNAITGFASGISLPVDLKVSTDGGLYYLARGTGSVNKISARNVALASNGATAIASTAHASNHYPAGAAINGDRIGATWGSSTGGWNDNTRNAYPDILEVDFPVMEMIDQINVFTLQNNWTTAGEPMLTMPATGEGLLDFLVQYCSANCDTAPAWTTIPGGNVAGNDKAWRPFTLSPTITSTKIRVVVNNSRNNWSRIVEVEALGCLQ